jgi:hypothetical protein
MKQIRKMNKTLLGGGILLLVLTFVGTWRRRSAFSLRQIW